MKKKVTIVALAVLLAIFLITLISFMGKGTEEKSATEPTTEPVATTEEPTTEATEEVTIPGLEDSIFEDEPEETTEATAETTVPNATQPKPTEPKATEPKPTEPKATEPKPTEPKPTEPAPTESRPSDSGLTEYEKFQNLSPAEQQEYMESFSDIEAFFTWYNSAKEEYEKANPPIEVDGGTIDIGAIIEGKK